MYGPSKVFSSSLALSSAEASLCRREAGDKEKVSARGKMGWLKRRVSILIIDLSACIPLRWANIKKWGRGLGGQFHTIHYILSTRASTWYLRLQGCMREISIAGESVPSTTLFHQIHVIWCRKYNWPVLKIDRKPVRNNKVFALSSTSSHTQISLCLGREDLGTM